MILISIVALILGHSENTFRAVFELAEFKRRYIRYKNGNFLGVWKRKMFYSTLLFGDWAGSINWLNKRHLFTLWIVYLLSLSKIILDFSPFLVGILTPLCPFTKPHHIYLHNSEGSLERRLPHCAPLFTESYYICTHILKVIAQKSWDVALQMCRQWKLQQHSTYIIPVH